MMYNLPQDRHKSQTIHSSKMEQLTDFKSMKQFQIHKLLRQYLNEPLLLIQSLPQF